jgi:hypothetical protein
MRPSGARSRSPMGSSLTRSKVSRSSSVDGAPSSPTTWGLARPARRSSRCGTSRRAGLDCRLSGIGQTKLGARDSGRRAGRLDPGGRGNGTDCADGRVGHHQLRHPRTAPRRSAARAVGRARVRRSALPEEPHQRADQAVTPVDGRCCRGNPRPRRAAVDRNTAHQPAAQARAVAGRRASAPRQAARLPGRGTSGARLREDSEGGTLFGAH